jgi:site-specific recombinase XerD
LELDSREVDYSLDDVANILNKEKHADTFKEFSQSLIVGMLENDQQGNARVYAYTQKMFLNSTKNEIRISDINYKVIKSFQDYLTRRGNSVNTISIHLRTLRAIIYSAIKEGIIPEDENPFKGYSIKNEKTKKRAVNKEVIKMVENLDTSDKTSLELYKDLFLFSFYCRGMNYVDMVFLKVSNVNNDRIFYTRQKTGQIFNIKITPKIKSIIDKYNSLSDRDSYIFPVIKTKGKEYHEYRNGMRLMNKTLKIISDLLNLDVPLTTYVTRHSWATIAKKSGISTAIISDGLGHESESTTQIYLDSFDTDVLDNANDLITS